MKNEITYKKVGTNFQITLPQKYCRKFEIEPGSILTVNEENDKLVIQPALDNKTEILTRLQNIFEELGAEISFSSNEAEIMQDVTDEIKSNRAK